MTENKLACRYVKKKRHTNLESNQTTKTHHVQRTINKADNNFSTETMKTPKI